MLVFNLLISGLSGVFLLFYALQFEFTTFLSLYQDWKLQILRHWLLGRPCEWCQISQFHHMEETFVCHGFTNVLLVIYPGNGFSMLRLLAHALILEEKIEAILWSEGIPDWLESSRLCSSNHLAYVEAYHRYWRVCGRRITCSAGHDPKVGVLFTSNLKLDPA
jgi:hypothetical protein